MTIHQTVNGTELTLALAGRLDVINAPALDAALKASLSGVTALTLDFSALDYISSAGLRILMSTQKVMSRQGKMVIRGANESILEVF